ncbi:MAG: S9 family peptidase [Betaproteobacteria bacterium]|nr:MAG: S9 family peptidase [Betaproteobacteria bacterium]
MKKQSLLPPVAPKRPYVTDVHGKRLSDDYHWMRDKQSSSVRDYLSAENAYTQAMMKPSEPLQKKLYREMLARIKETDTEVPYKEGDYFYYSRTRKGQQYRIYCRKPGSLSGREQVILDLNILGKDRPYISLGALEVSGDGKSLAYSLDYSGFREYTLRVRDLGSGVDHPETIEKARSVTWAADNRTLFYVTEDETKRACRVWRRVIGETCETLIYEETDARFSVSVSDSRSRGYIFITSHSATTSEVRFLRADMPLAEPQLFQLRRQDHEYYVDHGHDGFYVLTNDRGRNFRVAVTALQDTDESHWQELIPHRDDVMLEGIDVFSRHVVFDERKDGFPRLSVRRVDDGSTHVIALPEPANSVYGGANAEFDTTVFRFHYESYVTPDSVYDYDLESRSMTLLKRREVRGPFNSNDYRVEVLQVNARDGAKVPVSMVYCKSMRRRGPQPMLLTGYGAYGYPHDVHFSSTRLSLLDRGVIYAVAHVRGGGELGKRWHDEGRMLNKRNSFTDFIACAEHLIESGYTDPSQLVIEGGSAGGLLVGAVTNMRPGMFRAVIADVPFVDVINTMLDDSLPLTTGEYEEWGNPADGPYFDYMLSYSPYDNIVPGEYPAMLVETSLNDSQVMYWEPAKYVAKLRAAKTDRNPLLLRINMDAGHGGASGRYDFLKEIAFSYAFILGVVGVTQ